MAFDFSGFNDALLTSLSKIGIDLHITKNDSNDNDDTTPKLIYEISKQNKGKTQDDKHGKVNRKKI